MTCLHCGADVTNGLGLCELCQRFTRSILEMLPVYFRNLARWRPGRASSSRQVPGSRVLYDGPDDYDGTGDRISDRLDEAANMLTTWARLLVEARGPFARPLTFAEAVASEDLPNATVDALADDPALMVAALCAAFEKHLTSIATLEWCGQFVRDLAHHEPNLRGLTETLVPGWYAGGCRQIAGFDEQGAPVKCGMPTYVVPGLTWVTCGACGATTYARDHLEVVLDEARGWVARPKRLAEAVVALLDTEPSVPRVYARIRKWSEAEAITPIRRTERAYTWSITEDRIVVAQQEAGFARYRFGDVLDLVTRRNARRADEVAAS